MLKALEGAIAAVDCSGPAGFTQRGTYAFELLSSMKVSKEEDLRRLILKLDVAASLIVEDATDSGRRCSPHCIHSIH